MEFLQREELPMTTLPTEHPVTPLRLRMLDDMAMRAMRARTQHDYVRHVRGFAAFLGRSPDTATAEDVRRFQLHQREHGVGESTIGGTVSALRFLFGVTLERPDLARRPRKLPDVLSVDEVGRLLEAAPGIKYRAALGVAYGGGLRVSEVAHLKVDDIDSKRMLLRIEEGRGEAVPQDRQLLLNRPAPPSGNPPNDLDPSSHTTARMTTRSIILAIARHHRSRKERQSAYRHRVPQGGLPATLTHLRPFMMTSAASIATANSSPLRWRSCARE
jgi:hypothetical protein